MVELRGHHLLCMLTFVGKGYTAAFTRNYEGLMQRMNAGEAVKVVAGPDAICAGLLKSDPCAHCHDDSVKERDAAALQAVEAALGRPLPREAAFSLSADDIERLRAGYSAGQMKAACEGCEWQTLCAEIAASGFSGVRLFGK